jgi:[acyl-carrier-protein] S-malonyltransferase
MGKAWADKHPTARLTFADADQALGFSLSSLCFDGPEERLNRTDMAQVAIYVASVACFRVLQEQGAIRQVAATAGLSLGEFTALHLAGAFDFLTGLKLVQLRGQAMQEAAEASPSGMVALVGADEIQARQLCERACPPSAASGSTGGEVLVPANFNCPGQVVISGSMAACERAVAAAGGMGLKATPLKVAGAFHSPLMAPAAERLAKALDAASWSTPFAPVMSNVTAGPHEVNRADAVKRRLVEQLTSPVRWEQSMAWLIARVPGRFVELAPNKVLSGLMRRIDRNAKVESFAEPA